MRAGPASETRALLARRLHLQKGYACRLYFLLQPLDRFFLSHSRRGGQGDVHCESRTIASGGRQRKDGDGLPEGRFLFWRD